MIDITVGNYIGGMRICASGSRRQPIFNPALGKAIREVALSQASDVERAVDVASAAYPAWAATPPAARARVMFSFKRLLEQNTQRLAAIITEEHGKTLPDAAGEIARGLEIVDYCTGICELLKGEYSAGVAQGIDAYSMRMPLGVTAGITPFNFPAKVPRWMLAPAIASGNAFVLKPSERDPSASLLLAELLAEAGLPEGVLNVVQGDKEAVDCLLEHPKVRAISFVGSTPIAKYIYATGAAAGKRVQALGGAKNHMVVLPDADIGQAADALMGAVYGAAGERCMAISVAVPVGEKTADALVEELAPRVRDLKIGPGTEEGADMGPLVTAAHRDRVASYIETGVAEGAKLVVDGRGWSKPGCEEGFFLGGSLFDHATADMAIYREEIFGPVLTTIRAKDAPEALKLVDEHQYGNGTAVFTRDGMAARQFAASVEAGMVGINVPIPVPVGYHSFGGWKDSLFGSNAIYGPEGIRFYTRLKTVTARWPGDSRRGPEFTFPRMGS